MPSQLIIVNQGTTLTTATLLDRQLKTVRTHHISCPPRYLSDERWEQDPEAIWSAVRQAIEGLLVDSALDVRTIAGLGITNQRETVVLWDRQTGQPVHPAITWQDRRTEDLCTGWRAAGHEADIRTRTGLLLDPQFSASKLHWLLAQSPQLRARAGSGELLCGTMDSFLLWRLTDGAVHATDATNAARTLLYNLRDRCWDRELLDWFGIPAAMLPEVRDNASDFGRVSAALWGYEIPILGMVGDQQASLLGHGCLQNGDVKATYGSGCFALVNTGNTPVYSQNRLLTTLGYQIGGRPVYALEGSVVTAGSVVDWLEEDLNMVTDRSNLGALAETVPLEQSEIMVPAFTGLGAPYWEQQVRGALFGLTRDTRIRHLVAAALRSVAYQTEDMLKAMRYDNILIETLRVDGGDLTRRWFLQSLADITGVEVLTGDTDTITARGTGMLLALQLGWYDSLAEAAQCFAVGQHFQPSIDDTLRDTLLRRWDEAVMRIQAPLS